MPRPAMPPADTTDFKKLEQIAHAESDHGISSAVWSADGQHLLFLLHGQLFEVSPGQQPQRLAEALPAIAEIIPSPMGPNTALRTANGDIYLLNTSQPVYRSPAKDVFAEELHWSPDGQRIALIEADLRQMPVRGIPNYLTDETTMTLVKRPFPGEPSESRRIGIVSAQSSGQASSTRWATLDGTPMDLLFGLSWSPDSRTLLVDRSDLYIKDRRLLLIDTSTGASTLLVRQQDPKNVTAEWWSSFGPDGKSIYFTSDHDTPDYQVYVKPLTPAPPIPVTSGRFAVFASSLAARSLFITTNEGSVEQRQTFRVPLPSGAPQQLTFTPGTHTTVPSPDGHYLADIFSSDATPPDLFLIDTTAPKPTPHQVTNSPLPEFAAYHWSIARYVDFPNVHDGTNLHARLTLPPTSTPIASTPLYSAPSTPTPSTTSGAAASSTPPGALTSTSPSRATSSSTSISAAAPATAKPSASASPKTTAAWTWKISIPPPSTSSPKASSIPTASASGAPVTAASSPPPRSSPTPAFTRPESPEPPPPASFTPSPARCAP